jgi:hypothetical protein
MGWSAAQRASGTSWIAPYLALAMDDPYDAVRFIAARSLRTLPGFDSFQFDFVASPERRVAARTAAMDQWRQANELKRRRVEPALLINPDGTFETTAVDRLRRQRNNRRVVYRE